MRLQVTPREAQVFIDGYFAGIVDNFDGAFQRLRLQAGEHSLQLFLQGHRLYTQDVYLQPGNTFTVRHTMETLGPGETEPAKPTAGPRETRPRRPLPAPPDATANDESTAPARSSPAATDAYGTLTILVQPGDALVLVDGNRWNAGEEALEVELTPGSHTIEVRKSGFRGYLTEISVRSGETSRLNVALSPER
jgi:hypothetical protein